MKFAFFKCLTLIAGLASASSLAHAVPQSLFTPDGRTTVDYTQINAPADTLGQQFTAQNPFKYIRLNMATWGVAGGFTLRLYAWNVDYATSIAAAPLATNVFTGVPDNTWAEYELTAEQPAGQYLIVVSDKTNPTLGVWAYDYSQDTTGQAFRNGASIVINLLQAFNDIVPDAEKLNDVTSFAQDFNATQAVQTIKFKVATWGEASSSFDMAIYAWNTDYATSVLGAPAATRSWSDGALGDNSEVTWTLDTPLPAGHYLVAMTNPGATGTISWWRSRGSGWGGDTYTAFVDGERVPGDRQFWFGPSATVDLMALIDDEPTTTTPPPDPPVIDPTFTLIPGRNYPDLPEVMRNTLPDYGSPWTFNGNWAGDGQSFGEGGMRDMDFSGSAYAEVSLAAYAGRRCYIYVTWQKASGWRPDGYVYTLYDGNQIVLEQPVNQNQFPFGIINNSENDVMAGWLPLGTQRITITETMKIRMQQAAPILDGIEYMKSDAVLLSDYPVIDDRTQGIEDFATFIAQSGETTGPRGLGHHWAMQGLGGQSTSVADTSFTYLLDPFVYTDLQDGAYHVDVSWTYFNIENNSSQVRYEVNGALVNHSINQNLKAENQEGDFEEGNSRGSWSGFYRLPEQYNHSSAAPLTVRLTRTGSMTGEVVADAIRLVPAAPVSSARHWSLME